MKPEHQERLRLETPAQTENRHEQHRYRAALAKEGKSDRKKLTPKVGKLNSELCGFKPQAPSFTIPNRLIK